MLTIGDRIKYFRKRRSLTQAELADITGIHPVSIRKYETNKMLPQLQQIEKIAEALGVNSGAISGSQMNIHLETEGDLMGLLMNWHKSGILTVQGERGEKGMISAASARFVLAPVFGEYFKLIDNNTKKEEAVPMESLSIKILNDSILNDFLRWEMLYVRQQDLEAKYGDATDEQVKATLDEVRENLELIEMELQGSVEILK